jgi:hypothetical protein
VARYNGDSVHLRIGVKDGTIEANNRDGVKMTRTDRHECVASLIIMEAVKKVSSRCQDDNWPCELAHGLLFH